MDRKQPSFVGRDELLRAYRDTIHGFSEHSGARAIINLHAITGMGKTWFARLLYDDSEIRARYTCVWISFEPDNPLPGGSVAPKLPADEAVLQTIALLPGGVTRPVTPAPPGLAQLLVACDHVEPRAGAPLMVIVDALNVLEQLLDQEFGTQVWEYLQEQLIKPLIEHQALVLAISQGPLQWSLWDLQQQCASERLPPFDMPETTLLTTQYELQSSAGLIHYVTYGHPASITAVIRNHLEPESRPPLDISALQAPEEDIRQRLEHLSERDQDALAVVGLIRRVDANVMRYALEAARMLDPDDGRSLQSRNLIRAYVDAHLLTYRPDTRAYVFAPDVRIVIRDQVFRRDFARYARIYSALSEYYLLLDMSTAQSVRRRGWEAPDFIDWIFYSLGVAIQSISYGPDGAMDLTGLDSWISELVRLWEKLDATQRAVIALNLNRDIEVQEALQSAGLYREVLARLGLSLPIPFAQAPQYMRMVFEYLFRYRLSNRITEKDSTILIQLARYPNGFGREEVRQALMQAQGREPTAAQIATCLVLFSQTYIISYQPSTRTYQMNEWLQQFLARMSDPEQEVPREVGYGNTYPEDEALHRPG